MEKYYLNDIAKMYNIPESTLRYYDTKGVLKHIQRDNNNYRYMHKEQLETIKVILCLKQTGMELKHIKQYLDLVAQGDSTLKQRQIMIEQQYQVSLAQLALAQEQVDYLAYKKNLYQELIAKL